MPPEDDLDTLLWCATTRKDGYQPAQDEPQRICLIGPGSFDLDGRWTPRNVRQCAVIELEPKRGSP